MRIPKKRCQYCHRWFEPDKRKVNIQMTCVDPECQHRRQAETSHEWRVEPDNAVSYSDRRGQIVSWAKEEEYWKKRRKRDRTYREREAKRMRDKRRKAKTVAKQISITGFSVEERARSLGLDVVCVAKQISIPPFFIGERRRGLGGERFFSAALVAKRILIRGASETSIMGP